MATLIPTLISMQVKYANNVLTKDKTRTEQVKNKETARNQNYDAHNPKKLVATT